MAVSGRAVETLVDVPAHVWKGLPDGLRLGPSAVNPMRIGKVLYICIYLIYGSGYFRLGIKLSKTTPCIL